MQQKAKPTAHDRYRLPLSRRLSGRWRVLPDFIILGAQKAGTTTIYDNLVKHPDVRPCDIKEVHFFDRNWDKGANWYRAHFPFTGEISAQPTQRNWITGEGSPYYLFHPLVPARVHQLCPESRLIVVLRDPVERAYSHYQHEKRKDREPLSFEDALAAEEGRLAGEVAKIFADPDYGSFAHQHFSYKARGYYADQLEAWHKLFPRDQILILESRELNRDFPGTFSRLYDFLGLQQIELPQPKRSNVGSYEKMGDATRAALVEHFRPHNERLFTLLGRRFDW